MNLTAQPHPSALPDRQLSPDRRTGSSQTPGIGLGSLEAPGPRRVSAS